MVASRAGGDRDVGFLPALQREQVGIPTEALSEEWPNTVMREPCWYRVRWHCCVVLQLSQGQLL